MIFQDLKQRTLNKIIYLLKFISFNFLDKIIHSQYKKI